MRKRWRSSKSCQNLIGPPVNTSVSKKFAVARPEIHENKCDGAALTNPSWASESLWLMRWEEGSVFAVTAAGGAVKESRWIPVSAQWRWELMIIPAFPRLCLSTCDNLQRRRVWLFRDGRRGVSAVRELADETQTGLRARFSTHAARWRKHVRVIPALILLYSLFQMNSSLLKWKDWCVLRFHSQCQLRVLLVIH